MKKFVFIVAMLISICGFSQTINPICTTNWGKDIPFYLNNNVKVTSRFDTTVLFAGIATGREHGILHTWAEQIIPINMMSCAVMHDAAGCPDTWANYNIICTKCLRHLHIHETRTAVKEADPYTEAVNRLNKLKH